MSAKSSPVLRRQIWPRTESTNLRQEATHARVSLSFVRVARNSPRVGRTLIQRWWGEAVVAKVRLHVPVDYFRVADDTGSSPLRFGGGEDRLRRLFLRELPKH